MTLLKVKSGTRPRSLIILSAAHNAIEDLVAQGFDGLPKEIYVTAGENGQHMEGSRHGLGDALDIRSKTFKSSTIKRRFLAQMLKHLGPGYEGLLEAEGTKNEHFHIEYDPKG